MPNIAAAFRDEITRLARREIRSQTALLRRTSAQYRRDIAKLKRNVSQLRAEIARIARQGGRVAVLENNMAAPERIRFSAKGVIAQRRRLGIAAADFGRLVGVTGHTIYQWERGTSRPRRAQVTALASVRGLGKREVMARLAALGGKGAKRRARTR